MSETEPSSAEANVARLHELLTLRRLESEAGPRESDLFVGPSQYKPDGRVFGGQVLAQCIVAASATVGLLGREGDCRPQWWVARPVRGVR